MQSREFLINISNLPPDQKKHCTELLSNHDIVFEQENQEFTARIVIDPAIKKSMHTKIKEPEPKRNITQLILMQSFKPLIPLMKTVQVYIYPKKLSIEKLQNQLEVVLENFFKSNDMEVLITHNLKGCESFPQFFFNYLSKNQPNKIKFQQWYVNLLESINHFKNRHRGVKVFELFLSKEYGLQELLFFYFLRKMIQTLRSVTLVSKNKLRISLYSMVLQEENVVTILNSYLSNSYNEVFEEIKREMRYDTKMKKNVIGAYDLIHTLLQNFNQREESVEARQRFLRSVSSSISRQEVPQQQQNTSSQYEFTPQQNVILLGCLEAVKKLCQRIKASIEFYDNFSQLISKLLTYTFTGNKMGWFQLISLEPTSARLLYFETLQQDYLQYCSQRHETNLLLNRLIRQAMQAPGLQQSYARLILNK